MTRRPLALAACLVLAGCGEPPRPGPGPSPAAPLFVASGTPGAVVPAEAPPETVGGVPVHPRGLKPPAPLSFAPAPLAPVLLVNGTKVFVAEDHTVPLVTVTLYLRTGVLEEPAGKAGLAELTGELMRDGGAGDWDPDALEECLDAMGASVGSRIDRDRGVLTLTCRTQDLARGLEILRAVLEKPRFDERRFAPARDQMLASIRRRKDDPEDLAMSAFATVAYGAGSPWARQSTLATVGGLTRDDVLAFHKDHVLPCLWSIAVSGAVAPGDVAVRLEAAFGSLPRREGSGPEPPEAPAVQAPRVLLLPREGTQATLCVGHAGLPNLVAGQPHPDRYAIHILNWVLGGGGFTSRLVKEVRTTRGLTYSTWSAMPMESARGMILMGCQTRTEKLPEALSCMREILSRLLAEGATDQEVALAQAALINAFVFRVATPAARATNAALYDYAGLPADYLSRYVERLRAVTPEEVTRAARAHCHPDRLSVVVCGDKGLEGPLGASGGVEVLEPEP